MERKIRSISLIKPEEFERLGKNLTLIGFLLVVITYLVAPVLAISWRRLPFPGFFVEQTLVVNQNSGDNWSGWLAGIKPGERITRLGGNAIFTLSDYVSALESFDVGSNIVIFTQFPDGSVKLYPEVTLSRLSSRDFGRFFWLPYLLGFCYFGVGIWIYRARGNTRSGLALAIFCILTSAVCAVIFDLSTTHLGAPIYSTALSFIGAALVSLAMCFPQEWRVLRTRVWLLAAPYLISFPLAIWNLAVLYDHTHPWAYQLAWAGNYQFLALAILFFIGVMIFHASKSFSSVVRRQARIVLLGSGIAFIPLMFWFISPIFHLPVNFNIVLFLPPLIIFPLSISIAILRYRLLEIDAIVNRTLVYGLLTAILAGVFGALVTTSQRLFMLLTGEKSDIAIIITTVIVSSIFPTLRSRIQSFVDNQFKENPDNTKALQYFGEQVSSFVMMSDPNQLTLRLLEESAVAVKADNGALSIVYEGQPNPKVIHTYRSWKGQVLVSVPLETNDKRYGFLMLGPKLDGRPYSRRDYQILYRVASQIAVALRAANQGPWQF